MTRFLLLLTILLGFESLECAIDRRQIKEDDLKKLNLAGHLSGTERELDISNFYINLLCDANFSERNISAVCARQMEAICNNTEVVTLMADAWSKYPYAGMLTASRGDYGAYDQCLSIDYQSMEGPRILGKQCTFGLAIPVDLTFQEFYLLSYCVPHGCSALDLAKSVTIDFLPEQVVTELVNEEACSTKETFGTLDASSIVVATLFCLILALVVLCTFYEIFLHQRKLQNKTPILTAFSAFSNGRKLTQTTQKTANSEQILSFHGIKVLSMMWIIAGHAAAAFSFLPVTNRQEVADFETERYSQYLTTAHLAVDTFFFISGFLMAYQYFKGLASKPILVQIMVIPQMIVHRYLRITPVVLMFFLYSVYLSKHVGNGPIFGTVYDTFNNPCKKHWWAVFLYIQNYYNRDEICWVHLWYLSADWQLFLVAPLVLIPMAWLYKRNLKLVFAAMAILNILFVLLAIFVKLIFPKFDPEHLEYDTHSKLVTYFMGAMFGIYMRCHINKPYVFRRGYNLIMWALSLLMLFAATVVLHEVNINHIESHTIKSITDVLIKPFWALGLAFVIYSCTSGYGGIVNWLLTAGWMQVMSKLTFCMYITHMPVIFLWISIRRTREHFTDFTLFFYWCGHLIVTIIVSTIWTLMFESPLITIERALLGGGKRPKSAPKQDKPKDKIVIIHKKPIENGYV